MNKQLFENLEALRRFISAKGSVYHEYAPALEAACNELAERATQPARRQSQIDIHRITCEEARKIGGGLIDTTPADDVTALGRAIYQRILDSQPAQDQPAAVRAVQKNPHAATFPVEIWLNVGDGDAHEVGPYKYLSELSWCWESIDKYDVRYVRADLAAAAPSPQPELSGSIDSDEFRQRLRGLRNYTLQESMDIELNEICEAIDAWKDAACAEIETKRQVLSSAYRSATARATDAEARVKQLTEAIDIAVGLQNKAQSDAEAAEAKLTAIREGVAAMICWVTTDDGELCQSVEKAAGIQDPEQAMVRLSSLLALLQPPSQSDTNGLPGKKEESA